MSLTRSQLKARVYANCRVTVDQPDIHVADADNYSHEWAGCGCTYLFTRGPDGLIYRFHAIHCSPWGE